MNDITLKEHIDIRLESLDEKMSIRLEALDKALNVAKIENDRRLEGMNEFRAELERSSKKFVTKESNDILHNAQTDVLEKISQRLRTVEQSKSNLDGRIVGVGFVVLILTQLAFKYL